MYLKTLTMRGFKSFASATSLRFEPGITCVVGPNGSGKSNIVDAFSWVMGEQGVKTLRGGKMEDVVFAGTAGRPALGRAEVTLTIDNSDGALPIDYAEVTISRLLFRSGQSEYAINGDHCRLLDVQELLSDTGLGREMHVIVGQGQLDEVLNAGPEARRALIEEAAGVLKHRKRKEKALRKLEAMQVNLTRLVDLTGELGRRLKPLGRQAEIARRAAVIQADFRDARLRLLADDYVTVAAELDRDQSDEAAAMARRAALERSLAAAREREAELDLAAQQHAPRLAAAQQAWFALSGLTERLRGVLGLATERHRHLSAPPEPQRPGRDPDELDREAAGLREQEAALGERLAAARELLAAAVNERTGAEAGLIETDRRLAEDARSAVARAERLARLRGQVEAARATATAADEEAGRLAAALAQARARAEHAQQQYGQVQDLVSGRDEGRSDLMAAHEQAKSALAGAAANVTARRAAEHAASDRRAALGARTEALEEAVRRGADASGVLLAGSGRFGGVVGAFAALLTVEDGGADAIAAALGASAAAVAVSGIDEAAAILAALKTEDAGRADLVIAAGQPHGGNAARAGRAAAEMPPGVRRAVDLVKAPGEFALAVEELLAGVAVATDLAEGLDLLRSHPQLQVVTLDGDLIGAHWARGGSAGAPSLIGMRAAAQDAAEALREAESSCQRAERDLADAADEEDRARQVAAEALARLQEADAEAAEISGRLGTLAGAARAASDEAGRLAAGIATAERARENDQARLAELESRCPLPRRTRTLPKAAESAPVLTAGAGTRRAGAARRACGSRAERRDGRPAGGPDRRGAAAGHHRPGRLAGRGGRRGTPGQAAGRGQAHPPRASEAALASAVAAGASYAVARIGQSLSVADADRQAAELASSGRDDQLKAVRAQIRELSGEFDKVVDSAHGAEIARASRRMQLEQIAARAADEFAVDAEALTAEYGPGVLVPQADESLPPLPYDRAAQEKRAQAAQRLLDQLGKVNPLALEEFAAQQERHAFLVTQLEDLKKTRRDLLTVIKEVDDRVLQVFAAAYEDTAREFERCLHRAVPRRRWQAGADRARRHAQHRDRLRGQAAGQEGQATVAAVRRRAGADRDRLPDRDLQGQAVAVLRAGRGRGRAR